MPRFETTDDGKTLTGIKTEDTDYGRHPSIVIPDGIEIIDLRFFEGNYDEVIIPNGVKKIMGYSFAYSDIKKVNIPDSVVEIGDNAFIGCSYLERNEDILKFVSDKNNPVRNADNFYDENGLLIIDDVLYSILDDVFEVVVPDGVTKIVNSISERDFNTNKNYSIRLPDSVTTIGVRAFKWARISEIHFGKNVSRIETEAFSECVFLNDFSIPDSVEVIEDDAFSFSHFEGKLIIPKCKLNNAFDYTRCNYVVTQTKISGPNSFPWGCFSPDPEMVEVAVGFYEMIRKIFAVLMVSGVDEYERAANYLYKKSGMLTSFYLPNSESEDYSPLFSDAEYKYLRFAFKHNLINKDFREKYISEIADTVDTELIALAVRYFRDNN